MSIGKVNKSGTQGNHAQTNDKDTITKSTKDTSSIVIIMLTLVFSIFILFIYLSIPFTLAK